MEQQRETGRDSGSALGGQQPQTGADFSSPFNPAPTGRRESVCSASTGGSTTSTSTSQPSMSWRMRQRRARDSGGEQPLTIAQQQLASQMSPLKVRRVVPSEVPTTRIVPFVPVGTTPELQPEIPSAAQCPPCGSTTSSTYGRVLDSDSISSITQGVNLLKSPSKVRNPHVNSRDFRNMKHET